jgi:hypothetical protein
MIAYAQQQRTAANPSRDGAVSPASGISQTLVPFLQRSGLGPAAFVSNVGNTLASGGTALAPDVRSDMEGRFQRDFSSVRVHDDARAHDSARDAQAAAYTVGNHIVFGAGRYDSDSHSGRQLLAHELAHTVQQGGVQFRRLDGIALEDHAGLEQEADRAADAAMRGATPAPLSSVNLPRLSRAPENETFPTEEDAQAMTALKTAGITYVETISRAKLGKTNAISVDIKTPLPVLPKGDGDWVKKVWDQYAGGKNLVFKSQLDGDKVPSIKESAKSDEYRGVWLQRYNFKDLKSLGASITAWVTKEGASVTPAIKSEMELAATNFAGNRLGGSQVANIDHIVEKQVGGASIIENMQILNAEENQKSGVVLNQTIVAQANEVLDAVGRKGVGFIRLRYGSVSYLPSKSKDAYDQIEALLRGGKLTPGPKGAVADQATGNPVTLQSGAATSMIYIGAKGTTAIAEGGVNDSARRLISGLDLIGYKVSAGGSKAAANDQVSAVVDSSRLHNAIRRAAGKGAHDEVELDALPGEPAKDAAAGSSQVRQLKISGKSKELDFFFPYLSPGKFTKLEIAGDNSLAAEGYIEPTLKFLKRIDVVLAKDSFRLRANLGPENFQPPFRGFKVTESSLALQLAPEFKPSGTFKFQIGPEAKPYALGDVTASVEAGAFAVNGSLTSKNLPGVDNATGKVRYTQAEGWSGEVKATTSKLPRTKKTEVTFGFRTVGGATQYYAGGQIEFDIGAGKDLTIGADYRGDKLIYQGKLIWEKPIKLVDRVDLGFLYDGDVLTGTGSTDITYKGFSGKLTVNYRKAGDEEAKLSGKGAVAVKTAKAEGSLELFIDPKGVISGKGSVSYVFSDRIKPTVGVILHPDGHLTLTGKIELTQPIQIFPKFPKEGGERDLIKLKLDFIIPGPFPGLADPMVHLGAGVRFSYGIGPGQIVNTVIEGSFDPLEENKNVKLKFTSTFEVPGHVGLTGILEAGLGIAVLGGLAAKAHAGLRIEPGFMLNLNTRAPITAEYDQGDFSFEGRLEMQGGLTLGLGIKLYAHLEAIGGALEKEFTYDVKNYSYDVGQQMTLTLAKIGYSTKTGFKAPSLDDIKINPGSIDPIEMIKKVANSAKSAMAGQG